MDKTEESIENGCLSRWVVYCGVGLTVGIGLYFAVWFAVRGIYFKTVVDVTGWEWAIFPVFFGVGSVLWVLGGIELKEAKPGYGVRK